MAEPVSSTATGAAVGWNMIGGATGAGIAGAGIASIVVMCMTRPRTTSEWIVALISTVVGSICGGSFAVQHFGLQSWANTQTGLMALAGIMFVCGLPAWAIVRWVFNYISARERATITQVVAEVREAAEKVKG